MLRKAATMSLLVAILIVAGCGGSEEPVSQEDTAAITTLVGELNRVTADRDADGFCELMQPTQMEATFHGVFLPRDVMRGGAVGRHGPRGPGRTTPRRAPPPGPGTAARGARHPVNRKSVPGWIRIL